MHARLVFSCCRFLQYRLIHLTQRSSFCTTTRMAATIPRIPLFQAISEHDPESAAVIHSDSGRTFTYGELLKDVATARDRLSEIAKGKSLEGERVAFLIENSYDYVVTFLSVLAAQGIAMPLSAGFPAHELQYIVDHAQPAILLTSEKLKEKADELLKEGLKSKPIVSQINKTIEGSRSIEIIDFADLKEDRGGMMLYTSGTTSRPKGVWIPQSALDAQADSLVKAWKYRTSDRLLHCLPLHHVHGVMNAMLAPLFAGATIEFQFPFNPDAVWNRFSAPFDKSGSQPDHLKQPITFFTVVPTIWSRLLSSYKELPLEVQENAKRAISPTNLRLNFSGSAALPTPTKKAWTELSGGNVLLERYGMTEVGMALSCGLAFDDRVDGSVGWPLPHVEARLFDADTNEVIPLGQEKDKDGKEWQGEIQLRGPTVFKEYWSNPDATESEFVQGNDGKGRWFKTGDIAIRKEIQGAGKSGDEWAKGPMYFIQGRKSADIIKTGGEKVSALEVEREMLSLPEFKECAVVAVDSEKWGQKVAAVVVLSEDGKKAGKDGKQMSPLDMRRKLKDKLVAYKVPQDFKVVDNIPRNAMGKVNKKQLVKELWGSS